MRIPELLVPASSLEVLKTAVIFGADAVYIGGEVFSLRAKSKNFSLEDMKEGIDLIAEELSVFEYQEILMRRKRDFTSTFRGTLRDSYIEAGYIWHYAIIIFAISIAS